ncbi:hypothetical protein N7474_002754 [Penicillium riverlandense]|uniref:uncharacterized protein n=1 Tax=Penicillium riverlandense TaxID=1903569 RepID=UPI0025490901|nr:uncharacterized protein N7474_002754 [Penicillium riverlandense]KAJ5825616.1 hypothetical protein N7474_002754 [Penicillium riverlandense]
MGTGSRLLLLLLLLVLVSLFFCISEIHTKTQSSHRTLRIWPQNALSITQVTCAAFFPIAFATITSYLPVTSDLRVCLQVGIGLHAVSDRGGLACLASLLACLTQRYAYPAIKIELDLAKIKQKETEEEAQKMGKQPVSEGDSSDSLEMTT